jgi:hypothetical protein
VYIYIYICPLLPNYSIRSHLGSIKAKMAPKRNRPRWAGDVQALAAAMEMAKSNGIQYVETASGKLDAKLILLQKEKLCKLFELQPSLVFKKKDLEKALALISESHAETWKLSADMEKDFRTTVAKRMMAMLRHVSTSMKRPSPPQWVYELGLPGWDAPEAEKGDDKSEVNNEGKDKEEEEEEAPASEKEDEQSEPDGADDDFGDGQKPASREPTSEVEDEDLSGDMADADDEGEKPCLKRPAAAKTPAAAPFAGNSEKYFVGYSNELESAWRCLPNQPLQKEYTKDILLDEKHEMSPAIARFKDGMLAPIPELSTLAHRTRTDVKTPIHQWWAGQDPSGAPIVIKDRSEGPFRPMLVSMFLSSKHVCNVKVTNGISHTVAKETMMTIGKLCGSGEVLKGDLYPKRDSLLEALGFSQGKVRKKPAAAASSSASAEQPLPEPPAKRPACKRPAAATTAGSFAPAVSPLHKSPSKEDDQNSDEDEDEFHIDSPEATVDCPIPEMGIFEAIGF